MGRCGEEGWIRKGKSNRKNQWCESGKIENVRKPKARVASPPEVDFSDPPMPPSATDPQTGVTFRNGTLCLAKGLVEMRITGSPVPRSVMRRGRSGAWEDFFPEFRLVFPYRPAASAGRAMTAAKKPGSQMLFEFFDEVVSPPCDRPLTPAQQRKRAFEQFRFSLPKRTARILEPFRTHQWQLLVLLHHDPDAAELAESNPALAFALAQKLQADRELIASLRCSGMRQRDLLGILDLPSSPAAVNLFRKIDPRSVNGDNWPALVLVIGEALREPKPRLNHLSSINTGVVEILLDARASAAATPTLLEEVAEDRSEIYRGRVVHLITSTLRMQEELRTGPRCQTFPNLARLRAVHDEVSENYRRRVRQLIEANACGPACFPPPPVPGIPGRIEPVTSASDLVDEGEMQGNCVASYAGRVREGNLYIYRVLKPERATLSITRSGPFAEWEIGELECRFNTDVSEETEELVQAWLDRYGLLA